jgi:hypothetical protein
MLVMVRATADVGDGRDDAGVRRRDAARHNESPPSALFDLFIFRSHPPAISPRALERNIACPRDNGFAVSVSSLIALGMVNVLRNRGHDLERCVTSQCSFSIAWPEHYTFSANCITDCYYTLCV